MVAITVTGNLQRHVHAPKLRVEADTVASALNAYFEHYPGVRGYVLDDQGAVRHHMLVLVDGLPIQDRAGLSDELKADSAIHVFQALSGG